MITDSICDDYHRYKEWFFTKQLKETLNTSERNILFARNPNNSNEIISMACLKKDNEEQKICTLYVSDKYRDLGLGTQIIESSMQWLGTTKPLITLADYKIEMFSPIIKKYDWELTEVVEGLYNNRTKELCFNGSLTKNIKNNK
ncbi:MAG: GNAT family N-acetyltransferase [Bacilli bacterium]